MATVDLHPLDPLFIQQSYSGSGSLLAPLVQTVLGLNQDDPLTSDSVPAFMDPHMQHVIDFDDSLSCVDHFIEQEFLEERFLNGVQRF